MTERPRITLGTRRWDHLIPLTLGEVSDDRLELRHRRFDLTPTAAELVELDAVEVSLSHTLLGFGGRSEWIPLPAFTLAAFRHRCVITRRDSPLTKLTELAGRDVGLTGWADTGNVWTKALLLDAGVSVDDVRWHVGPLGQGEPPRDRMVHVDPDAGVDVLEPAECLTEELAAGRLDAVLTPTMPAGFHAPDGPFRHLITDYPDAEAQYFAVKRYIPGLHLVAVRRASADRWPWLPAALVGLLRRSFAFWQDERRTLVDTTPWLIGEFDRVAATVGLDWSPYDPPWTERMVDELLAQYVGQRIGVPDVTAREVFAEYRAAANVMAAVR